MNQPDEKQKHTPKVSIGMPVYNGEKYVREALDSLLAQTFTDFELIISDNGSTDGSSEVLRAVAARDGRISYFRQDHPIRAYDNFRFVLEQARGEYFMWAAHDDQWDSDFVAKLVEALEQHRDAVLAFGDLNIVTPEDEKGRVVPFHFETLAMGWPARLLKLSRLQCYYIYGVWRAKVIRRVPYAYCAWWPDLPMMLAAAVLGTFVHVRGTRFHYFEVPKSNLARVKAQDYSTNFSLPLGVAGLIAAVFRACSGVGGPLIGAYAAGLVILKQVINLPGFIFRRLSKVWSSGSRSQ